MYKTYEEFLEAEAKHERDVYDNVRNNPIEVVEKLNKALRDVSKVLKADVHVTYSLEKRKKRRSDFACKEDYVNSVSHDVDCNDVDCKYRIIAKISVKHTDYVAVMLQLANSWRVFVGDSFSLDCAKAKAAEAREDGYLGIELVYNGWAFYQTSNPGYFTKGYERLCERVASYSF